MNKIIFAKAVFSFQEDDGGVRGKVGVRLGDVVGEVGSTLPPLITSLLKV